MLSIVINIFLVQSPISRLHHLLHHHFGARKVKGTTKNVPSVSEVRLVARSSPKLLGD